MIATIIILLAMLLGEPIPWWIPVLTGGLALLLHGLIIVSIAWTHNAKIIRRKHHEEV